MRTECRLLWLFFFVSGTNAIFASSLDEIDGWRWTFPPVFNKVFERTDLPWIPDLGDPEILARDSREGVFALEVMGRLELAGGERPLAYLRRGYIEYLKEFRRELERRSEVAAFWAAEKPEVGEPSLRLHSVELVEARDAMPYLRYATTVDGVYGAKALMLWDEYPVHVQFFDLGGEPILAEMRLDTFLAEIKSP